jgi:hypothetical protein
MAYAPEYGTITLLRSYAPGFSRLGQPIPVDSPYNLDMFRKNQFELSKTKGEVIKEYYHVMGFVWQRITLALLAAVVGIYFFFQMLAGGGVTYLLAAMLFCSYALYKYWHSGAAYSNWQEFEMRPMLVPIENIATEQDLGKVVKPKGEG